MLKIAKKYKFDVQFLAVNYRNKLPQTELRLIPKFDFHTDPINWSLIDNVELLRTNDNAQAELVINKDLTALPDSELIKLFFRITQNFGG